MKPILEIEGISKRYRIGHQLNPYLTIRDSIVSLFKRDSESKEEFWALKDITFNVDPGDAIAIIGKNGAGKSTLLKVLSKITHPTSGQIIVRGRVASLLEVGTGFHPELSGRENIFLNGSIMGLLRQEILNKFDEIVDFSGVEKFLDTPLKHFSTGMQLRLAFAVAAHLEPDILAVDEVLAVGDAGFQKKCLAKMGEVTSKGMTLLFVSHNLSAVQNICNKAIVIDEGKIVSQGNVNDQINEYLSSFITVENKLKDSGIKIGKNLLLKSFEMFPNPVLSLETIDFNLEFLSSSSTKIFGLAILFYNSFDQRVSILDLRNSKIQLGLSGGKTLKIEGVIKKLPFIEGEYKIGLYIDSNEAKGNFLDLFALSVLGKKDRKSIIPYPLEVRGLIELEFDLKNE